MQRTHTLHICTACTRVSASAHCTHAAVCQASSWHDAGVRLLPRTSKLGKSASTGGGGGDDDDDDGGGGGGAFAGLALVAAAGYYLSTGSVDLGGAPSFTLDTSGVQKQLQARSTGGASYYSIATGR